MKKKIAEFLLIARFLVETDGLWFAATITLGVLVAFADTLGVALLVPLIGPGTGAASTFHGIPFLSYVEELTKAMSFVERMFFVGWMLVVLSVVRCGLQFSAIYLNATVPLRTEWRLGNRAYAALMNVQIAYVNSRQIGDLMTNLVSYPNRAAKILQSASLVCSQILSFIVYIAAMLVISWKMTALAIVLLGLGTMVTRTLVYRRMREAGANQNRVSISNTQLVYETFNAMKLIRLRGAEALMEKNYARALGNAQRVARRIVMLTSSITPLFSLFAGLTIAVLIFAFAAIGQGDAASSSLLIIFIVILSRLVGPAGAINSHSGVIKANAHGLDELRRFFAETAQLKQMSGKTPFAGLKRDVRFENVTLRYNGAGDSAALDDLSIIIPKGGKVGIVGASGAGKTSLIAAITRLHEITGGRITADGVDIRDLRLGDWRRRMSVVSQDIAIFNDTVKNNLTFGLDGVSDEEVHRAAALADIDGFIRGLDRGYETILGDRGVRLSGGQQQRVALARALLAHTEILILDEATSSLDSLSEARIQAAIDQVVHDRTVLIIAHRLSTVQNCDIIYVLDHGHLAESGTHAELMAQRSRYWRMVSQQTFEATADDVA